MRLQRHSAHGVLKTLKTVKQLVEKGSREFRKALRKNDEHVKSAPDYGTQQGSYMGTAVLEQVRGLSLEVLQLLFDQSAVERDGGQEQEVRPLQAGGLSGMGRSGMGDSQGRLEGFGNEPVDKSSMIDKARDMLESVINIPDPKQQIMELCLKDDVGSYEPVYLPGLPSVEGRRMGGRLPQAAGEVPKVHVPGRAGGGWEDSSDEEQARLEELSESLVSEDLTLESTLTSSVENKIVKDFCLEGDSDDMVDKCEEAVKNLLEGDTMGGLFCLVEVLESGSSFTQLRGLFLLELLINTGALSPATMMTICERVQAKLELSEDPKVAMKAKKIHMVLKLL